MKRIFDSKRLFFLLSLMVAFSCSNEGKQKSADTYERKLPAEIRIGKITGRTLESETDDASVESIRKLLEETLALIAAGKGDELADLVSREQGVYIDLKAHRKFEVFQQEIRDPNTYIYSLYFDSESLQKRSDDPDQICFRELFQENRTIHADLFFIGEGDEVEIKLYLQDTPKQNFRLNNPVLIRERENWKFLRLF